MLLLLLQLLLAVAKTNADVGTAGTVAATAGTVAATADTTAGTVAATADTTAGTVAATADTTAGTMTAAGGVQLDAGSPPAPRPAAVQQQASWRARDTVHQFQAA